MLKAPIPVREEERFPIAWIELPPSEDTKSPEEEGRQLVK
jgi:hypothetical protein